MIVFPSCILTFTSLLSVSDMKRLRITGIAFVEAVDFSLRLQGLESLAVNRTLGLHLRLELLTVSTAPDYLSLIGITCIYWRVLVIQAEAIDVIIASSNFKAPFAKPVTCLFLLLMQNGFSKENVQCPIAA